VKYKAGKAALIWLLIAFLAIVNGMIRESILVPSVGTQLALPLSGISLSIIVITVTFFTFPFFVVNSSRHAIYIGIQWFAMTLSFEFILGYFVLGKSWLAILQIFNIAKGDLFSLVLLSCLIAPLVVARIKGSI
jgi:hypothetical protein